MYKHFFWLVPGSLYDKPYIYIYIYIYIHQTVQRIQN